MHVYIKKGTTSSVFLRGALLSWARGGARHPTHWPTSQSQRQLATLIYWRAQRQHQFNCTCTIFSAPRAGLRNKPVLARRELDAAKVSAQRGSRALSMRCNGKSIPTVGLARNRFMKINVFPKSRRFYFCDGQIPCPHMLMVVGNMPRDGGQLKPVLRGVRAQNKHRGEHHLHVGGGRPAAAEGVSRQESNKKWPEMHW
jgi:hypothetical protein